MNEVRNIIIGFDLGKKVSQLCYYDRRESEPVSVSMKVGTGQYTFPNCLSKKPGADVYHFGLEVEYFAGQQGEIYLDNIREICLKQKTVTIDGEERSAGELLGIFMQQALRMLGVPDPVHSTRGIMVTTPELSRQMVENIRAAFAYMGFPKNRCFLQDYDESFYYHTLYQKPEIWSRRVGLFSFDQDQVTYQQLVMETGRPIKVSVRTGDSVTLRTNPVERDADFYEFAEQALGNAVFSSIYLVGDGFHQDWADKSIKLLCRHQRRVFYGNNLYAKGACCAAREKTEERNLKSYLYSGSDLVRVHAGMDMTVSGSPAHYVIVEGGVNWYEAEGTCEILLDDTSELIFQITNIDQKNKERYVMALPGLPKRPPKATRLRIHMEFSSAVLCQIKVTDLGFGDLYPSSGLVWEESIDCEEVAK